MLASASSAMAKSVKSDSVSFKTAYAANGEWSTTTSGGKCTLTSDGEFIPGTKILQKVPCELRGRAVGIGTEVISVDSGWASADGLSAFTEFQTVPRITSKPPTETYAGGVNCEEEEEEGGLVFRYPCLAKIKLVFNTLKKTVTGSYAIYEESTMP